MGVEVKEMSLSGYIRKRIGTRLYKPVFTEDESYAKKARDMYRDEGYFAELIPSTVLEGLFTVWRSVNPRQLKK